MGLDTRQLEKQIDGLKDSIHGVKNQIEDSLDQVPYEQLFKFPWFYRWGVFLLLFSLFSGGYFYLFFTPINDEITLKTKTRDDNGKKIRREMARMKKLPTVENELALIKEKLSFAQQEFPTDKEIPLILERVSQIAIDNGLVINMFRPSGGSTADYYEEVNLSISMIGKFHQIMHFINDTKKIPRLIRFSNVNLAVTGSASAEPNINFTGRLITYRYIEGSEETTPKK